MPEYLAPGVYVEEIAIGPASIEGVSTSTTAFIGETERGPLEPQLITGMEEYRRVYGRYSWILNPASPGESQAEPKWSDSFMRQAIEGFFVNGGKRAFVARVLGQNPETASVDIRASTGGGGAGDGVLFTIKAAGPGIWGNCVGVAFRPAGNGRPDQFSLTVEYRTPDADPNNPPWLAESYDNLSSDAGDRNFYESQINGVSDLITIKRRSKSKSAVPSPTPETEKTDKRGRKIRGVAPENLKGGTDGAMPAGPSPSRFDLPDYEGGSEVETEDGRKFRTGLAGLKEIDEISIICAPNEYLFERRGETNPLTLALVDHCEALKNRIAILQAPQSHPPLANLKPPTDSEYAAYYFPWIKVTDGQTGLDLTMPPVGHVAGIYARTDIERGVFKAPANEVVRGAIGLQSTVLTGDQEVLNPRGVNCIRALPNRGIRVWGARTISSDPMWKYVNVRRLFIYLEESIRRGTQWVVFEPNNETLWDRLRQTVSDFLVTVWHDGGLMGRTREEAFFVKCDRTTMTENDIENGRVIVVIGVAAVRPAEFVIFRIAQWQGGSSAEA